MSLFKQKSNNHNQELLDEIHQRPEVKKTFRRCEIFETLEWLTNLIFFALICVGIWFNTVDGDIDLEMLVYLFLNSIGGYAVYPYLILQYVFSKVQKKLQTKLQVLEDEGVAEIQKAQEEGTYQPGDKVPAFYRVFRQVRKWTLVLAIVAIVVVFCIKFL